MSDEKESAVKVFCRFRPPFDETTFPCEFSPQSVTVGGNPFKFSRVFSKDATQEDVYNYVGRPLLKDVFEGINVTIFSYGQSGSGKTSTMSGTSRTEEGIVSWDAPETLGIIPRLSMDLFNGIAERMGYRYTLQISYVEIYLETVRDLLSNNKKVLSIRESPSRGPFVDGVTQAYVSSAEELLECIRKGDSNRSVAATKMNEYSSRSHSLVLATVEQEDLKTNVKTISRLTLVDLAGSERAQKTQAEGIVLRQAQATNKSLMTLGLVIRSLIEKKVHVPYRDSKLTRLLRDSLGGNSKTNLVVTCSQGVQNLEETISTLRFGVTCQGIQNIPKVNFEMNIEEYKRLLVEANEKLASVTISNDHSQLREERDRLLKSVEEITSKNEELSRTIEDLTLRNDELSRSTEDLNVKNDELSTFLLKSDELQRRNEDLQRNMKVLEDRLQECHEREKRRGRASESLPSLLTVAPGRHERRSSIDASVPVDLYESKCRHIEILEEALQGREGPELSNMRMKVEQLEKTLREQKEAFDTQRKRIRELESQIRVSKTLPLSNVFRPIQPKAD